ncbi:hypothetical protein BN946_scf184569.g63 [Trametes cinnabarina]|uniref:Uncharacterized protein n=1 Tax=Pycnoporus cinnabarinus TaxID=5643 RepID=A0A060S833_PYCCI|nr:hypothetical protein BN946_scf184569.g63 [Trametes cinnabarina]
MARRMLTMRDRILCWWGIWTLSVAPSVHGNVSGPARSAQLGTLASPLFTMVVLLFGSGVPTAEKPVAQKFHAMSYPRPSSPSSADVLEPDSAPGRGHREGAPKSAAWTNYRAYRAQTSILVPLPPAVYRALPRWVQRWVLLDLPMYEWTPAQEKE